MRGLVLRLAEPADDAALRALARWEPLPAAPLLVAEDGGVVRAALALRGEGALGDPDLCGLLRARKRTAATAASADRWTFRVAAAASASRAA